MKIVFCLSGDSFSGKFLDCWTELIGYCTTKGITPVVSRKESRNAPFVGNMGLGDNETNWKFLKPFDGKIDYDYIMWIDSNIVFSPSQFQKLLDYKLDIVSGIYPIPDESQFAVIENWDEQFFNKNGYFKFLTALDIRGKDDLIEVAYSGMGFMLVKRGVFESMQYPWCHMNDFTSEDVAFCLTAREKGFKIFITPQVRLEHEKSVKSKSQIEQNIGSLNNLSTKSVSAVENASC